MKRFKYSGKYFGSKRFGWLYGATCPCCRNVVKNDIEHRGRKKRARFAAKKEIAKSLCDF